MTSLWPGTGCDALVDFSQQLPSAFRIALRLACHKTGLRCRHPVTRPASINRRRARMAVTFSGLSVCNGNG